MIIIDGIEHKATWLQGLEQSADILNGENSGRLQATGKMHLEYQGTYLNHKGDLMRDANCSEEEWSELFELLITWKNDHIVSFPFGVNKTLTQSVYLSGLKRNLRYIKETNKWAPVFSVVFTAMGPACTPTSGSLIKGLS